MDNKTLDQQSDIFINYIYVSTNDKLKISLKKHLFLIKSLYLYILFIVTALMFAYIFEEINTITFIIIFLPFIGSVFFRKRILAFLKEDLEIVKINAKKNLVKSENHKLFKYLFRRNYFFYGLDNQMILDIYINLDEYVDRLKEINNGNFSEYEIMKRLFGMSDIYNNNIKTKYIK